MHVKPWGYEGLNLLQALDRVIAVTILVMPLLYNSSALIHTKLNYFNVFRPRDLILNTRLLFSRSVDWFKSTYFSYGNSGNHSNEILLEDYIIISLSLSIFRQIVSKCIEIIVILNHTFSIIKFLVTKLD